MPPLKPYSSELNYSYAPGVFPSLQLMQNCPERAQRLLLSEKASGEGVEKLREICRQHRVREEFADKALSRISGKQNCFAAVVFEKWQSDLKKDAPHVVLHHPMDEGNLVPRDANIDFRLEGDVMTTGRVRINENQDQAGQNGGDGQTVNTLGGNNAGNDGGEGGGGTADLHAAGAGRGGYRRHPSSGGCV